MTAANLRSAIHIASLFGIYLSVAMMVPALADFYVSNPDAIVFTRVSVLCTALFAGTAMATREAHRNLIDAWGCCSSICSGLFSAFLAPYRSGSVEKASPFSKHFLNPFPR
ncbi:hypothetical protein N5C66_30490 [Rhizobium pusense]|uniref:Uncharacterized protein n=1 Tax=Agrobacterium genomosp. 2 str. CFBP 5494 TaxID=1183436 RepID=A0A9W5B7I6_9HYPH|nr:MULTISPECIES: hypothetical protein [Rhizobium/Agrobacterium group]MDH0913159.1 hypothetical protein [Agrobacterium pusense]MDH1099426.1 hypothetical protein [Agrobacterium pusense]MDH1115999.1 hypothetical protein [Agrobacterium pusense]MDH2195426.1 hypothetical protein [Agrobacterium pusense]CUX02621.1 exported hypothetical protein [Agrobacterium genomosp. 2 str. CFBP 5494]